MGNHRNEASGSRRLEDPDRAVPGLYEREDALYGRSAGTAGHRHTETATESRQGLLDRPILIVLIAGLILAAIFVVATQIWSASEETPDAGLIADQVADPPAAAPEAAGP